MPEHGGGTASPGGWKPDGLVQPSGVVLVCTLGGAWAVVPEVLGHIDPDHFRVFPSKTGGRMTAPSAVWAVTTLSPTGRASARLLRRYWASLGDGVPELVVFAPEGLADLSRLDDNRRMAEILYRLMLAASEADGPPYCSLAGGRKTMSSLLQKAAGVFGARQVFHVVSGEKADRRLHGEPAIDLLSGGLPPDLEKDVQVVELGPEDRFDGLDWSFAGHQPVRFGRYPVCVVRREDGLAVLRAAGPSLWDEVEGRIRSATHVAGNYFFSLLREDRREGFRGLYRLRPSVISALRTDRIGIDQARARADLSWLRRLPKADLHCHLGGVAAPDELPEIAGAVRDEAGDGFRHAEDQASRFLGRLRGGLSLAERIDAFENARTETDLPSHWFVAAVILGLRDEPELLAQLCSPGPGPFVAVGIERYMAAGRLQGSALLQSPGAISAACRVLCRKAAEDNVRYLELRCSPVNCTRYGLSAEQALEAIRAGVEDACAGLESPPRVELVVIGTRHGRRDDMVRHVRLAAEARSGNGGGPGIRGFDLAGDEAEGSPEALRPLFIPLFQRCLRITVHAGESEPVERVWEAVYHLNADRIGHGLAIVDHPELMARFRDRGTAVELCPSSNDQVVGFRMADRPGGPTREYPLRRYLDGGLRVCVCTDNPGISRTTWSRELYQAARLTPGGLSRWEVLSLVYEGFRSSFLPAPEREALLRQVDEEVFQVLGG